MIRLYCTIHDMIAKENEDLQQGCIYESEFNMARGSNCAWLLVKLVPQI